MCCEVEHIMKQVLNSISAILPKQVKGFLGPPYYKFMQHSDPTLRSSTMHLRALQGKYRGKRCFIMGNGPSLNKTPLEKLEGEYVWGLNRCYMLFDRIQWKPSFYTAVDARVVSDIALEINELSRECTETLFFFPLEFYIKGILKNRENTMWYRQIAMDPLEGPKGYFSLNAAHYLRGVNTVSIAALQLAVYMGFNPIYLIGCDLNYTIPEGTKASGEVTDLGTGERIVGYELTSTTDNDPNHFDPRYFGSGAKWHAPNVDGMIYGYQRAKEVCDTRGIKVFNATIGGKLEVFPRISFGNLFRK